MRKTIVTFILCCCTVPQSASAAGPAVTLREAVALALAGNHLLKAAEFEKSATDAGVKTGRSRYFPRLVFEEGAAYTNSPTKAFMMRLDEGRFSLGGDLNNPDNTGDFRTALMLEQPLYDRKISTGLAMAEKEQERGELTLEQRRQDVAYNTVAAYLEVQKSAARLKIAAAAVSDAREHQRLAEVRSRDGVGLRSDELRAGTFVAEMEQQLIAAANRREIALLRLARIAGLPSGERLDIRGEFQPPAQVRSRTEMVSQGVAGRADLKGLEKGLEQAGLGLEAARSAYLPTLYAMAGYQMNDRDIPFGRDNDAWLVGATLRWEVFDGGGRDSEKERAFALKSASEEYLHEQRTEAGVQVAENYLRWEETGKRLEVARHMVLQAEEALRLVEKRYENSLSLLVELLDVQSAVNRARGDVAELEADYAATWAKLQHVSGTLLKEIAP